MSRKDWENEYNIIAPPDTKEDEWIRIPILGIKDTDSKRVMNNAFRNGSALLKDARSVSEYSKIVLLSLSAELFLKAIICKTTGNLVRGHDLQELFFKLNKKEQVTLLEYYIDRNFPKKFVDKDLDDEIDRVIECFENSLAMNAMCFETLRYKHELATYVYNLGFIANLAADLERLGAKLELIV